MSYFGYAEVILRNFHTFYIIMAVRRLDFNNLNFQGSECMIQSVTIPNLVAIGQTVWR